MPAKSILERRRPRRARTGHTDYRKRLKMIKSREPRLVVRRTSKHIIVQLIEPRVGGDYTAVTATSKVLKKLGWRAGTKSLPAAYLTGFLAGRLALKKGYSKAIVDLGMHYPHPGSRLFAAVKGAIDAGLSIPVDEEVLPPEERIKGHHITEYFVSVSSSGGGPQFASSDPDFLRNLAQHVKDVMSRIAHES